MHYIKNANELQINRHRSSSYNRLIFSFNLQIKFKLHLLHLLHSPMDFTFLNACSSRLFQHRKTQFAFHEAHPKIGYFPIPCSFHTCVDQMIHYVQLWTQSFRYISFQVNPFALFNTCILERSFDTKKGALNSIVLVPFVNKLNVWDLLNYEFSSLVLCIIFANELSWFSHSNPLEEVFFPFVGLDAHPLNVRYCFIWK